MKHVLPLLLLAMMPLQVGAQSPGDELRTAERVYNDLARQFDGAVKLPLHLRSYKQDVAAFDPQNNVILIETPTLRAIAQLGTDSLNALAYVLGHELAHYHLNHSDRLAFKRLFAPLATVQRSTSDTAWAGRNALYAKWQLETEADFRAGFSSYLAGYNPLSNAPRILNHIYTSLQLDTAVTRSHPPLADRLEIVRLAQTALADMVAMFDGATQLMIIGRYHEAGRVYDHIATVFPASREVLSNAGAAKLLEAIALLGDSVEYFYPVPFETQTRGTRGLGFGDDPEKRARYITRLLNDAEDYFRKAELRDPSYLVVQINRAVVLNLRGDPESAMAATSRVLREAQKADLPAAAAHARVIRAIIHAEAGRRAEAITELKAAQSAAPGLAEKNLALITGTKAAAAPAVRRIPKLEKIGDLGRRDFAKMQGGNVMHDSLPAVGDTEALHLYVKQFGGGATGFVVATDRAIDMVISADANYRGESAEGIRIGSTAAEVRSKYGTPDTVSATAQGEYLVYIGDRMAFHTDARGRVIGWMIYGEL